MSDVNVHEGDATLNLLLTQLPDEIGCTVIWRGIWEALPQSGERGPVSLIARPPDTKPRSATLEQMCLEGLNG